MTARSARACLCVLSSLAVAGCMGGGDPIALDDPVQDHSPLDHVVYQDWGMAPSRPFKRRVEAVLAGGDAEAVGMICKPAGHETRECRYRKAIRFHDDNNRPAWSRNTPHYSRTIFITAAYAKSGLTALQVDSVDQGSRS